MWPGIEGEHWSRKINPEHCSTQAMGFRCLVGTSVKCKHYVKKKSFILHMYSYNLNPERVKVGRPQASNRARPSCLSEAAKERAQEHLKGNFPFLFWKEKRYRMKKALIWADNNMQYLKKESSLSDKHWIEEKVEEQYDLWRWGKEGLKTMKTVACSAVRFWKTKQPDLSDKQIQKKAHIPPNFEDYFSDDGAPRLTEYNVKKRIFKWKRRSCFGKETPSLCPNSDSSDDEPEEDKRHLEEDPLDTEEDEGLEYVDQLQVHHSESEDCGAEEDILQNNTAKFPEQASATATVTEQTSLSSARRVPSAYNPPCQAGGPFSKLLASVSSCVHAPSGIAGPSTPSLDPSPEILSYCTPEKPSQSDGTASLMPEFHTPWQIEQYTEGDDDFQPIVKPKVKRRKEPVEPAQQPGTADGQTSQRKKRKERRDGRTSKMPAQPPASGTADGQNFHRTTLTPHQREEPGVPYNLRKRMIVERNVLKGKRKVKPHSKR